MSDWHYIRNPESTEVRENRSTIVLKNKEEVLWQTAHRAFTVAELKTRQVPRKTGLTILSAVNDAGPALAASTLANILRGASQSGFIAKHPELLTLSQFGAEKGRDYNEVLLDVLAMWAKGFLVPALNQNKRLELSQKGKDAVVNQPNFKKLVL
jgi:hypothetical protein